MRVRNTATGTHASVCIALESNDGEFGTAYGFTSDSYTAIPDFSRMATISTNGNGFSLQSTSDYGSLRFYTNRGDDGIIERMRINAHGNIGIGTKDPVTMLDVNGGIRLGNTNDETAGIVRWSGSDFEGYSGTAWQSLTSGSTSNWSANDSSVFLDEVNVGIGTESPESRLQITDGDIYISDIEHGIIMKSPDGQCWRGTLDNSGNLNFTIVGCPGTTSSENAPELNFNDKISVYPNPSNQSITINVSQHYSENLTYQITNLKGQLLDNGTINSPEKQVDISAFPDAIYILSVYEQQGYKITSRKIIKE